jgi:hypothetical protein
MIKLLFIQHTQSEFLAHYAISGEHTCFYPFLKFFLKICRRCLFALIENGFALIENGIASEQICTRLNVLSQKLNEIEVQLQIVFVSINRVLVFNPSSPLRQVDCVGKTSD